MARPTSQAETAQVRSRAFSPLPDNTLPGAGGRQEPGTVRIKAREWRLRRAVELIHEAGEVGIGQSMLADLVRNPDHSPLLDDLKAVGATSSLEKCADRRGVVRGQRVWRLKEDTDG